MTKLMAVLVATGVTVATLIPALAWAYGGMTGPCTVTVSCPTFELSCSGLRSCTWGTGWVSCDSGPRRYCSVAE